MVVYCSYDGGGGGVGYHVVLIHLLSKVGHMIIISLGEQRRLNPIGFDFWPITWPTFHIILSYKTYYSEKSTPHSTSVELPGWFIPAIHESFNGTRWQHHPWWSEDAVYIISYDIVYFCLSFCLCVSGVFALVWPWLRLSSYYAAGASTRDSLVLFGNHIKFLQNPIKLHACQYGILTYLQESQVKAHNKCTSHIFRFWVSFLILI